MPECAAALCGSDGDGVGVALVMEECQRLLVGKAGANGVRALWGKMMVIPVVNDGW
jgi:hypothetical protein